MELPLLVKRVISFSWTKCIAEALLYTHSETLDIVSFKVSIFLHNTEKHASIPLLILSFKVVLPGQLAVHSCRALTAVAAQSKTVSQRVADRLLSTLTKCLEKDMLLVRVLLLGCTDMHCEVAFVSISTVVSSWRCTHENECN